MSNLRAAAQQALEALVVAWQQNPHWQITEAITAIRAALEQEEQEPVAIKDDDGLTLKAGWDDLPVGTPLYTTPPRREQEQEQPEPVARVIDDGTPEGSTEWIPYSVRQVPVKTGDLLYTHPPRREWQGLTDADFDSICDNHSTLQGAARAVEAKLKEKNHG